MKPKIWPNFYDIVVLPPTQIRDQAIKLSAEMHRFGSNWALGKGRFMPHLSLYHIPVRSEQLPAFLASVRDMAKGSSGGRLELAGIQVLQIHLAVFLVTDKPAWLRKLHRRAIKFTHMHFDQSYGALSFWSKLGLTPSMKRNYELYGTPIAGRHFVPHFTLGTFKTNESLLSALFNMPIDPKGGFNVDRIYICQLGEGFSCQKVIAEIPLGKS